MTPVYDCINIIVIIILLRSTTGVDVRYWRIARPTISYETRIIWIRWYDVRASKSKIAGKRIVVVSASGSYYSEFNTIINRDYDDGACLAHYWPTLGYYCGAPPHRADAHTRTRARARMNTDTATPPPRETPLLRMLDGGGSVKNNNNKTNVATGTDAKLPCVIRAPRLLNAVRWAKRAPLSADNRNLSRFPHV